MRRSCRAWPATSAARPSCKASSRMLHGLSLQVDRRGRVGCGGREGLVGAAASTRSPGRGRVRSGRIWCADCHPGESRDPRRAVRVGPGFRRDDMLCPSPSPRLPPIDPRQPQQPRRDVHQVLQVHRLRQERVRPGCQRVRLDLRRRARRHRDDRRRRERAAGGAGGVSLRGRRCRASPGPSAAGRAAAPAPARGRRGRWTPR